MRSTVCDTTDKDTTRKLQTYMSICKTPQQNTSKLNDIHHDQTGFTPGKQGWFKRQKSIDETHHINRRKDRNQVTISMGKKTFDKTQNHFR